MAKVPQQYYDTCAWVRHHYTQSGASVARTTLLRDRARPVYTLPMSEPSLDFVIELFPPPADNMAAAVSAHSAAQPRRSDTTKDTLENLYNRLLARIADETAMPDTAK
ncbi:hypothetical protein IOCL2690_000830600 [Leishmania lindenbergi]|uniref:Uncharacterized protein n=1 Tax=Leishmania lindenbergi TaxID=651832 RepID=A0AAW2ZT99_9TRYP